MWGRFQLVAFWPVREMKRSDIEDAHKMCVEGKERERDVSYCRRQEITRWPSTWFNSGRRLT
jgi:hypothetical protein